MAASFEEFDEMEYAARTLPWWRLWSLIYWHRELTRAEHPSPAEDEPQQKHHPIRLALGIAAILTPLIQLAIHQLGTLQ